MPIIQNSDNLPKPPAITVNETLGWAIPTGEVLIEADAVDKDVDEVGAGNEGEIVVLESTGGDAEYENSVAYRESDEYGTVEYESSGSDAVGSTVIVTTDLTVTTSVLATRGVPVGVEVVNKIVVLKAINHTVKLLGYPELD